MSNIKECNELKCYLKYSFYYLFLLLIFGFFTVLFYVSYLTFLKEIFILVFAIILTVISLFFIFMSIGNFIRFFDLKKNLNNYKTYTVKYNDIRKTIGKQYYFVVKIKDEKNKIIELNTSAIFSNFTMKILLKTSDYIDKQILIAYDDKHNKAITIKPIKK